MEIDKSWKWKRRCLIRPFCSQKPAHKRFLNCSRSPKCCHLGSRTYHCRCNTGYIISEAWGFVDQSGLGPAINITMLTQQVQFYLQRVPPIELMIWRETNFTTSNFWITQKHRGMEKIPGESGSRSSKKPKIIARKAERRLHHHKQNDRIETHLMELHALENVKTHCTSSSRTLYLHLKVRRICRTSATVQCIHHLSSSNKTVWNWFNHNNALYQRFTSVRVPEAIIRIPEIACSVHEKIMQSNEKIVNRTYGKAIWNKHTAARNARHR